MRFIKKDFLLKCCQDKLTEIYDILEKKPLLDLTTLKSSDTVLIIIDMINGFTKEGALRSPRVKALIPEIRNLAEKCHEDGIKVLAFADNHVLDSPEFENYPTHCVADTSESEVVDEIKELGDYTLIKKNSTNSFLEPVFQQWLKENPQVKNFIVVGDCTDICIEQFTITLKAHFNRINQQSRIIVPTNMVDTFNLGLHYAELMNIMALFFMQNNGIELVSEVI